MSARRDLTDAELNHVEAMAAEGSAVQMASTHLLSLVAEIRSLRAENARILKIIEEAIALLEGKG